jgi:gas vesicle protein
MGRFLLGFGIGVVLGVATVVLTTPRSGASLRNSISSTFNEMLDVAKQASAEQEQQLWKEFRSRANEITTENHSSQA